MKNLIGVKVKYSSPAIPPENISLNVIYTIGYDKELYVNDGNLNTYMDLEKIKMYFSPIDKSWREVLEVQEQSKEKVKKIKQEM